MLALVLIVTLHDVAIQSDCYYIEVNIFDILQKRNDFRYANGPAYCISAALMAKAENYFRYMNLNTSCISFA